MPAFLKPFTFQFDNTGKTTLVPKFEETKKMGLEHGFWYYDIEVTKFKSRQEKRMAKDERRLQNLVNKNKNKAGDVKNPQAQCSLISNIEKG